MVHRLIQRVTRERSRQNGELDEVVTAAADALEAVAVKVADRWDQRALLTDYAEHARVLWDQPVAEATQLKVLDLRGQLLHLLTRTHNSAAAVLIGPAVIADFERVLGPDHPHTLSSRNNLATLTMAVFPEGLSRSAKRTLMPI